MSQTVKRAIEIVELLSESPASLGEVADRLGVHKSTALRLLQTLETGGFARRGDDGRWLVGIRLIGIGQQALASLDVRTVAAPHLRRLGELCGHTVHLAQLIDHEVTYIDKVEGRDRVRMYSRIGKQVATHASGIGKAILAFVEEPLQSEVIEGLEFQKYTKTTITSPERFRDELALIRSRGWATDDGEFEDYIACIAAPVRGADGRVRAGVSVTTLQALASVTQLERLVPDLLKTADSISHEGGWAGP